MDPRFAARVTKVRGKLPISSFSAKAGNPERQLAKNGPPLFSEGDDGEWAMLKMVRVKLPISSFSAKAGNPEIHSVKHGPPLFSEGDEGEWAMVKMERESSPFRHSLRKQGIQKYSQPSMDPRFSARVTKVSGRW
jgi:predicted NUDIX family NTP pyrophosphohydrolase